MTPDRGTGECQNGCSAVLGSHFETVPEELLSANLVRRYRLEFVKQRLCSVERSTGALPKL